MVERKIPFLGIIPEEKSAQLERVMLFAQHVEPLAKALTVAVACEACFPAASADDIVEFANVKLSLSVSQFGQTLSSIDTGWVRFQPKTDKKRYATTYTVSIGAQRLTVGFEGKAVSKRGRGWLPKYLCVNLETVK